VADVDGLLLGPDLEGGLVLLGVATKRAGGGRLRRVHPLMV